MMHEAAVELGEQVVGKPRSTVCSLCRLQFRTRPVSGMDFCCSDTVAPIAGLPLENAQPIENTTWPHDPPAKPEGAQDAAVTAITGQKFIPAFAAEHYFEPLCSSATGQFISRQNGVIGHRIIHHRGQTRQHIPEIGLSECHLHMFGSSECCQATRVITFIRCTASWKAHCEGLHRCFVYPRHHGQQGRRIDAAGKKHAIGNIGALVEAHAVFHDSVQPRQGVILFCHLRRASRKRIETPTGHDAPSFNHQRFPGQNPHDLRQRCFASGGKLKLQYFVAGMGIFFRHHQARGNQRLGL